MQPLEHGCLLSCVVKEKKSKREAVHHMAGTTIIAFDNDHRGISSALCLQRLYVCVLPHYKAGLYITCYSYIQYNFVGDKKPSYIDNIVLCLYCALFIRPN